MSDVQQTDEEVVPLAVGTNDFKPWATGAGANVMPLGTYQASPQLSTGVVTGIADSTLFNRSIRQATFIAAGLAQFTANQGYNVLDNGNLTQWVNDFTAAIAVTNDVPLFATNAQAVAGNDSGTIISPSSLSYTLAHTAVLLTGGVMTGALTVGGLLKANSGLQVTGAFQVNTGGTFNVPAGTIAGTMLADNGVTNAKISDMPTMTVKANITGALTNPQDVPLAAFVAAANAVIPTYGHYQYRLGNTVASPENIPSGSHVTRNLNYANPANNIPGASLNANQVTLPAGTYKARAFATAVANGPVSDLKHQLTVRQVGTNAALCVGVDTQWASGSATTPTVTAHVQGMFVVGAAINVTVSSFCANGAGTSSNGGTPCNSVSPADPEVYVDLIIEKIA